MVTQVAHQLSRSGAATDEHTLAMLACTRSYNFPSIDRTWYSSKLACHVHSGRLGEFRILAEYVDWESRL